jgi:hypothetical protein
MVHDTTLPYSPYQNAKQEVFWVQVEGRLLPMLENVDDLTLDLLNEATLAWIEGEYNREVHSEIGVSPLKRFLDGPRVGKPCPSSDELWRAFRLEARRTQRKSDGTVSIEGRRFEVPSRYRHLERVSVRYARWDLDHVHMIDERTKAVLCPLYPLDKARNADGLRRTLDSTPTDAAAAVVDVKPRFPSARATRRSRRRPTSISARHAVQASVPVGTRVGARRPDCSEPGEWCYGRVAISNAALTSFKVRLFPNAATPNEAARSLTSALTRSSLGADVRALRLPVE